MRAPLPRRVGLMVKRGVDIVVALVLLAVLLPVLVAAAIAIVIESPGSPLFRQTRAGLHGHPFRIFKFRTMVRHAESLGPVLSRDDPRVTRVGRMLRRASIDEIPQLMNVLRGDMSLVGPRPQLLGTTHSGEERRLEMRPGMTGLVQVGRVELLAWGERMKLDIQYVDRWSLGLDLRILLRTIPVLLSRQDVFDLPRGESESLGGTQS